VRRKYNYPGITPEETSLIHETLQDRRVGLIKDSLGYVASLVPFSISLGYELFGSSSADYAPSNIVTASVAAFGSVAVAFFQQDRHPEKRIFPRTRRANQRLVQAENNAYNAKSEIADRARKRNLEFQSQIDEVYELEMTNSRFNPTIPSNQL